MTEPDSPIRMECPDCGVVARGKTSHLDRDIKCPKCGNMVRFTEVVLLDTSTPSPTEDAQPSSVQPKPEPGTSAEPPSVGTGAHTTAPPADPATSGSSSESLVARVRRHPYFPVGVAVVFYAVLAFLWPAACGMIGVIAAVVFIVTAVVSLVRRRPAKPAALVALVSFIMGVTGANLDMKGKEYQANYDKGVEALAQGNYEEAERRFLGAGRVDGAAEKLAEVREAIDKRTFEDLSAKLQEVDDQIAGAPCKAEVNAQALVKTYNEKLKSKNKYPEFGEDAAHVLEKARTAIDAQEPQELEALSALLIGKKLDEAHAAFEGIPACARRAVSVKKVEAELNAMLTERGDQQLFAAAQEAHEAGNIDVANEKLSRISISFSQKSESDALATKVKEAIRIEEKKKAAERARAEAELRERGDQQLFAAAQEAHEAGNIDVANEKLSQISKSFSLKSESDELAAKVKEAIRIEEEKKAAERARAEAEAKKKAEEQRRAREQAEAEAKRKQQRKERLERGFSSWDGSHIGLTKLIKASMNDPGSYEHVETGFWDQGDHLIVRTKFRGKNAFGGLVLNWVKAKTDLDGNVLLVLEQGP